MIAEESLKLICLTEGQSQPLVVSISGGQLVDKLARLIHKDSLNACEAIALTRLKLFKVNEPIPPGLPRDYFQRLTQGSFRTHPDDPMEVWEPVSDYWPERPAAKTLHVFVTIEEPDTDNIKRRHESEASGNKRPKLDASSDSDDDWLLEIHAKLWGRKELEPQLVRTAHVTYARYGELKDLLEKKNSDRDTGDYIAKDHDVLSVKLRFLESCHDPNNDETDSKGVDTELASLFPFSFSYLDLSSLEVPINKRRFPLPMLIREEYNTISQLIEAATHGTGKTVIVSGQPGTGKTAFLHLKVIESMISGRRFLYQTLSGTVYHVSDNIQTVDRWVSTDPVFAFVDSDDLSGKLNRPREFLRTPHVKIVMASSPKVTKEGWVKQILHPGHVTKLCSDLWSDRELYLTGIFLHPLDFTYVRLSESVSYFGLNPRKCFDACQSKAILKELRQDALSTIGGLPLGMSILGLLTSGNMPEQALHSVFQLSTAHDPHRLLSDAKIQPVSRWAVKEMLKDYDRRKIGAAHAFYGLIVGVPKAELVRGHIFKTKVLEYFDGLQIRQNFPICSLADSTFSTFVYPGPTERETFTSHTFTSFLVSAVADEKKKSLHLVPLSETFTAVDSIVYDSAGCLTFIQVTVAEKDAVDVRGLRDLQSWLKLGLKRGNNLTDFLPSSRKPWRLIFVVPEQMRDTFRPQKFDGDTDGGEWAGKVHQYVLGMNEDLLFGMEE